MSYFELYEYSENKLKEARKRNEELEKENAELKESYCLRRCKHCEFLHENGNCLKVGGYFTAVDNKDCPILKDKVELIKENAELKEKLEIEQNARGDWFGKAVTKDRRLNEAKELLRDLVSVAIDYIDKEDKNYSFIVEAEQFLSEVEK